MLHLHANLYALPKGLAEGPEVEMRGQVFPTLVDPSGGPPRFTETFPVTFEAMQQRLAELPSCDYEPDGFFLVSGHEGETFWRLNGHMHEYREEGEAEPRMHRVELHGECPTDTLDAVLAALGWPAARVAFELVQEGVTLRENDFRRWAASDDTVASHGRDDMPR